MAQGSHRVTRTFLIMDMRLVYWPFTFFIVVLVQAVSVHSANNSISADRSRFLQCMQCSEARNISDCLGIASCVPGKEVCYVEIRVTRYGEMVYHAGCRSTQACNMHGCFPETHSVDQTEYVLKHNVSCHHCCDGDFCNMWGCSENEGINTVKGTRCVHCRDVFHPSHCNYMFDCGIGNECILNPIYYNGGLRFEVGCERTEVCDALRKNNVNSTSHRKRLDHIAGEIGLGHTNCCKEHLCNRDFPTTHAPKLSNGYQCPNRSALYPSTSTSQTQPPIQNSSTIQSSTTISPATGTPIVSSTGTTSISSTLGTTINAPSLPSQSAMTTQSQSSGNTQSSPATYTPSSTITLPHSNSPSQTISSSGSQSPSKPPATQTTQTATTNSAGATTMPASVTPSVGSAANNVTSLLSSTSHIATTDTSTFVTIGASTGKTGTANKPSTSTSGNTPSSPIAPPSPTTSNTTTVAPKITKSPTLSQTTGTSSNAPTNPTIVGNSTVSGIASTASIMSTTQISVTNGTTTTIPPPSQNGNLSTAVPMTPHLSGCAPYPLHCPPGCDKYDSNHCLICDYTACNVQGNTKPSPNVTFISLTTKSGSTQTTSAQGVTSSSTNNMASSTQTTSGPGAANVTSDSTITTSFSTGTSTVPNVTSDSSQNTLFFSTSASTPSHLSSAPNITSGPFTPATPSSVVINSPSATAATSTKSTLPAGTTSLPIVTSDSPSSIKMSSKTSSSTPSKTTSQSTPITTLMQTSGPTLSTQTALPVSTSKGTPKTNKPSASTLTTVTFATTATPEPCFDATSECDNLNRTDSICTTVTHATRLFCPAYCGLCQASNSNTVSCQDATPSCASLDKSLNLCGIVTNATRLYCPAYCGLCGSP